jgi:hypothetical protein
MAPWGLPTPRGASLSDTLLQAGALPRGVSLSGTLLLAELLHIC